MFGCRGCRRADTTNDGRDAARLIDLRDRHVGDAEMADLAGALQLGERAHRFGERLTPLYVSGRGDAKSRPA
jgi:hypothetical protein